jgi:hypothetical protein
MSDQEAKIETVDAEIAGQKVKLTGTNLNNLFTVLVFILVCLIAYVLWGHTGDAKEASKFLAEAIKDQTQATREQTCVYTMPQTGATPELCKRISR